MPRTQKQIYASIFLISVAVSYLWGTKYIKIVNIFGIMVVDSTTLPKFLGFSLLVLSMVLLIKNVLKQYKSHGVLSASSRIIIDTNGAVKTENGEIDLEKTLEVAEDGEAESNLDYVSIVLTLISLIIFTLLMRPLGFLFSCIIYMIMQTTILTKKEKRKKKFPFIILFSLVFSVLVYYLFVKVLELILPVGILGI